MSLRSFIKRIDFNSPQIAIDYTIPIFGENGVPGKGEALCIDRNGSYKDTAHRANLRHCRLLSSYHVTCSPSKGIINAQARTSPCKEVMLRKTRILFITSDLNADSRTLS
ncbi:MAG: hypothetical protein SVO26_08650 [Chloroflexota bacterium]|nr:hypothetical protein [Chloroflexota bacterium]